MKATTGSLAVPNYDGASQTVKLTGPVKVVQVPVAPGQYVTGLLPIPTIAAPPPAKPISPRVAFLRKALMVVVIALMLLGGSLGVLYVRSHNGQTTPTTGGVKGTNSAPNLQATLSAQATATAQAGLILSDPLSSQIRNLPEGSSATRSFAFKNGAYHVTNLGKEGVAVVVPYTLPNVPLSYQLTMQEVRGDDTSPVNSFGMIFRYNQQTKGGVSVSTFYSFEVVNTTGSNGKYWFYKYDSSSANPWTPIWSQSFGTEFHEGQGAGSANIFKVLANGSSFSFVVNNKLITSKPVVDKSYASGDVGMLVNLDGTEVAFSNLNIVALPH